MEKTKREIKFRAWEKEKKIMFQWDELSMDGFGVFTPNDYSFDENADYVLNKNAIPMQYTGLKDKNGKEIYEGDIYRDDLGAIFLVEWKAREDGEYSNFYAGFDFVYGIHDIEVIGNIYENPNLLSSTNER